MRIQYASDAAEQEAIWRETLTQGHVALKGLRKLMHLLPGSPRCKVCHNPFGGFGGHICRAVGFGPSRKNPQLCALCCEKLPPGGAEIETAILFADIRGSTVLAASSAQAGPERHSRPAHLARIPGTARDTALRSQGMLGLFRKLRADRRAPSTAVDLRPRDCHCHVIPGVDDGSRSLPESLAMLGLLRDAGARRVVATSHIYPGKFDNEPEGLQRGLDELRRAVCEVGIDVELELGAEHFLDDRLLARIEAGRVIAFGPERYVLFETRTSEHVPGNLMDVVFALRERGYTPLMAHVERYHYLRGEDGAELCEDLRAAGAKFQVNRTVGKVNRPGVGPRGGFIAWLLERGWVDEVGSDLHRATADGRPHRVAS